MEISLLLLACLFRLTFLSDAFVIRSPAMKRHEPTRFLSSNTATKEDDISILFDSDNEDEDEDDDFDDEDIDDDEEVITDRSPKKLSRWDRLNPEIKARIVKAAQERAIANKKKREPAQDKKRRKLTRCKYVYYPYGV